MRKYFVEVTKAEHNHGGIGWEYGTCLWSPTTDTKGKKIYEQMKNVSIDDVVVHFYNIEGVTQLHGESKIQSTCGRVNISPPSPGGWGGRSAYYKTSLKNFREFNNKESVKDFVDANNALVKSEQKKIKKYYPFNKDMKLNQGKYLCEITEALYLAIKNYTK